MTSVGSATAFALGDEQQLILEQVSGFAEKRFFALQQRMDDEEWWPEEVFPSLGDAGYLGVTAPDRLGGADLDFFASGLVLQAVGRWNPAVALGVMAHVNLCLNNILHNGSDELLERVVAGMCAGTTVGALGLTEPGAGSDALSGMSTTARRDGDDYVLNGTKLFITNGPIADVVLVYAKTDRDRAARGISAFLVETDTPGFQVAQKLVKMGVRGSQTAELVFEDCRVPAANLVGAENAGVAVVMSGLDLERISLAFLILGSAERALDITVEYARDRRQFGQPIGSLQLVQGLVAGHVRRARVPAQLGLRGGGGGQRGCRPPSREARCRARPPGGPRQHAHRRRGGPGARRQRLHLGDGGQPALPRRQAVADRGGNQRGPPPDRGAGAAGSIRLLFERVLVATRGEIAIRVIRTLRRPGSVCANAPLGPRRNPALRM